MTQLWDKHVPDWRKSKADEKELSPALKKVLMELVNKISKESQPVEVSEAPSIKDLQHIRTSRQILHKKGKWTRVPPGA